MAAGHVKSFADNQHLARKALCFSECCLLKMNLIWMTVCAHVMTWIMIHFCIRNSKGPCSIQKACWCNFVIGTRLYGSFRLTVQRQLFLSSKFKMEQMRIWSSQDRRMRWILEGFPSQLFKLLLVLFCNMRSYVVLVENETFPFAKIGLYIFNNLIEIDEVVAIYHDSYCFAD